MSMMRQITDWLTPECTYYTVAVPSILQWSLPYYVYIIATNMNHEVLIRIHIFNQWANENRNIMVVLNFVPLDQLTLFYNECRAPFKISLSQVFAVIDIVSVENWFKKNQSQLLLKASIIDLLIVPTSLISDLVHLFI